MTSLCGSWLTLTDLYNRNSIVNVKFKKKEEHQQQASYKKSSCCCNSFSSSPPPRDQEDERKANNILIKERGAKGMWKHRKSLLKTCLLLMSLTVYWNTLTCDFVFDDISAIQQNKDLRPHVSLSNLFKNDFWGTPMNRERSHKSYRPLTVLTFRWNYVLGTLDPLGYHLINVVLHALVTLLYFHFSIKLTKSTKISFTAALLFTLHPIHTEAVTGVVGRAELLSSVFFLMALICYMKVKNKKWIFFFGSLFFATLALLSKEQGITVLAICLIYEILMAQKVTLLKVFQSQSKKSVIFSVEHSCFQRICIIVSFVIILLLFRMRIMEGQMPVFTRFDNPAAVAPNPQKQMSQNYLVSVNAWLLLNPSELCCDWTMNTIPLIKSIVDKRNLSTLLTYVFLGGLIISHIYRQKRFHFSSSVTLVSLSLLVVPFLPASNLFFPVGFVVAERVLYLPSMGFCLLIALGFHTIRQRLNKNIMKTFWTLFLLIMLSFHVAKIITRNWDWKNEYTIFSSGLKVSTQNAKLFNNVGHALEKEGNYQKALRYFHLASQIQPDDIGSYINVGRTYNQLEMYKEAEAFYVKAKSLLPQAKPGQSYQTRLAHHHLNVFVNLATLISRNQSRLEEADSLYRQAISMRSDYTQAYINRGDILIKLNRTKEAQAVYEKALTFESDNPDILHNLGVIKLNMNKITEALSYFNLALQHDPDHPQALLNSAILIQESGYSELHKVAIQRLETIVSRGQANEKVYFNLGMLAMDEKNYSVAEHWFRMAVQMKPDFRSALFNLALLLSETEHPLDGEPFLRQLIFYYPNHIKGLILLGDLNINHLGNIYEAEQCYRKILSMEPDNVQALHNLCVVMVESGKLSEARDCLVEALKLAPEEDYIQKHLAIVEKKLAK